MVPEVKHLKTEMEDICTFREELIEVQNCTTGNVSVLRKEMGARTRKKD